MPFVIIGRPSWVGGGGARRVINDGQMACALHYVNDRETALFYASLRRGGDIFAVTLDEMWQWNDEALIALNSARAAQTMGFEPTDISAAMQAARFINHCMGELYYMKPPPEQSTPGFEVAVDEGNRTIVIQAGHA